MYTRQVENLQRRLGKKGYPGGLKTQKGGPGKSLGFEAYNYVPLDHLATRLQYQLPRLKRYRSIQTTSDKQQSDEMLEDIGEISELKPNGITTHSCFLLYTISVIIYICTATFSY